MDNEKLEIFRILVEARITEINEKLGMGDADTQPIAPDVAIGRLSRLDSMQMQQMALNAKRRLKTELQKLQNALARLARIDKKTYGNCGLCRKEIAEARLEAQLDAVLCIHCAR